MSADLRHKTPEELRKEIAYQEGRVAVHDKSIAAMEDRLTSYRALVSAAEASLSMQRVARNNHHQRLVWAKNYLMMKEG